MKEHELLPCPFCGRAARFEEVNAKTQDGVRWSVGCELDVDAESRDDLQCIGWMSHQTYARKSEAAKAWNTRSLRPSITDGFALTEYELKQVSKYPDALRALADFHSLQETMADGMGMDSSAEHHKARALELRNEAARIEQEWQS